MTPNIVKGSNSLPGDRYDDPNHPRNQAQFQPDSLKNKQSSDNSSSNSSSDSSNMSSGMDGDHSAKTMDAGANAATANTDMASGIHEDGQQLVSQTLQSLKRF